MMYPLDLKKHDLTFEFRFRFNRYAKTIQPDEDSSDTLMLVNRQLVKEDLQQLISGYYWTDEELIRAGKILRIHSAGPRRRKIP